MHPGRLLVFSALSFLLPFSGAAGEALLAEDFEDAGRSPLYQLADHPLLEVVPGEGVDGGQALKATYQGYDRGSRRIVQRFALPERAAEITLCYDVRFERGFNFVRGGKLHGLGPDRPVTGGNPMTAEGWSARVNFSGGGGVRTYLYVQDNPRQYGVGRGNEDFTFEEDRYHAVSLHVRLNDPPEASNGFARVYVDGKQILDHSNVRFRDAGVPETLISQFLFSSFHGGNSPEWAPKNPDGEYATHHAYFDNFAIYRGQRIRAKPGACWKGE
jgi:hypothetical protein